MSQVLFLVCVDEGLKWQFWSFHVLNISLQMQETGLGGLRGPFQYCIPIKPFLNDSDYSCFEPLSCLVFATYCR